MKFIISRLLLDYFRFWARLALRRHRPCIVGVTGSAGKTSTLHAVEAALEGYEKTQVSHKANSQSGLSLHVLGLSPSNYSVFDWLRLALAAPWQALTIRPDHSVYIAELGIDGPYPPQNMEYLLSIFQPDIGIFTSVTSVHAANYESAVVGVSADSSKPLAKESVLRFIAKEKAKMLTSLPSGGLGLYNADDKFVAEAVSKIEHSEAQKVRLLGIGSKPENTVRIRSVELLREGTRFAFEVSNVSCVITVAKYWLPDHFAFGIAAGLAVALERGRSLDEAVASLEKCFSLAPGRATLIPAINGALLLDSSYNAAPEPVLDMFRMIEKLPARPTRLLALLGDMRELGALSASEHARVGTEAARVFDRLYLVGPEMKAHALSAVQKTNTPVEWFPDAATAATALFSVLEPGDLLLIKGSQNTIFLETAVEQLMADRSQANELLCRRGAFWDQQRAIFKDS